jgi:hypothetical protein
MVTDYGAGVRSLLRTNTELLELYDFRDSGVFEDATNYPIVVIAERTETPTAGAIRCTRVKRTTDTDSDEEPAEPAGPEFGSLTAQMEPSESAASTPTTIDTSLDERVMESVFTHLDEPGYSDRYIDVFDYPRERLRDEYWAIMPDDEWDLFAQIESEADSTLGGYLGLRAGTQTGRNDVYIVTPQHVDRVGPEETGGTVDVVPDGQDEAVPIEREYLRPWLNGRDVRRWRPDWAGKHLIYPYKTVSSTGGSKSVPLTQAELADTALWKYFTSEGIEESLKSREGGAMRDRDDWYAYTAKKSHLDLESSKLIAAETAPETRFTLDEEGEYFFKSAYGAPIPAEFADRRNYIAAYLNSAVFDFYLKHIASLKSGGSYKYTTTYVGRVPSIIDPDESVLAEIEAHVEQILTALDTRRRIEQFPEAYLDEVSGELRSLSLTVEQDHEPVTSSETYQTLNSWGVRVDDEAVTSDWLEGAESDLNARYLAAALDRRHLNAGEEVTLLYPANQTALTALLDQLAADRSMVDSIDIEAEEAAIDDAIAQLFGFDTSDRDVLDRFLETF